MAQLMPSYPPGGMSILTASGLRRMPMATRARGGSLSGTERVEPAERETSAAAAFVSALSAGDPAVARFLAGSAGGEALGSNNWVVDGTLTATGKPLLANDPHLATRVPSIWYLAH